MATFNLTVTVPNDKVDELQQMIDDRLNSAYGKQRVTTDEEGNEVVNYNYQEWIEVLIKEMLKANYKGWRLKNLDTSQIETDTNNLIS